MESLLWPLRSYSNDSPSSAFATSPDPTAASMDNGDETHEAVDVPSNRAESFSAVDPTPPASSSSEAEAEIGLLQQKAAKAPKDVRAPDCILCGHTPKHELRCKHQCEYTRRIYQCATQGQVVKVWKALIQHENTDCRSNPNSNPNTNRKKRKYENTAVAAASTSPPSVSLARESPSVNTGTLSVSDGYYLSYNVTGNLQTAQSDGKEVVVVLHGGPGAGQAPATRTIFDSRKWVVVLFDQRGCGQSHPCLDPRKPEGDAAALKDNCMKTLVDDLNALRIHLGVEKWVLFGGSFGGALAMCYATAHPRTVKALLLRGLFTLSTESMKWLFQDCGQFYPEQYSQFVQAVKLEVGASVEDILKAYYDTLTSDNVKQRIEAAQAFGDWEIAINKVQTSVYNPLNYRSIEVQVNYFQFATLETWFFQKQLEEQKKFMGQQLDLLDQASRIAASNIPVVFVHGRNDMVAPPLFAFRVYQQLQQLAPEWCSFVFVEDVGHAFTQTSMQEALMKQADLLFQRLNPTKPG